MLVHLILAVTGIAAGLINTVAGGGSLIALPALMLVGLPVDVANATNRLAIVSQSLAGAATLRRVGRVDRQGLTWAIATSAVGATVGTLFAVRLPDRVLQPIVVVALIVMALLILVDPNSIGAPAGGGPPRWSSHRAPAVVGLFGAALYGGFIQAGVGFLLLAVLGGILRYDVLGAAALKSVCTLVFGAVALAIFAAAGKVAWDAAVVLAIGTAIGATIGARLAQRAPHRLLRAIAFVAVVATTIAAVVRG